jgi:hypothetical protein
MTSERFRRVIEHTGPGPVDLGLAPFGTLRPLLGDFNDASKSAMLAVFWSHDRTMTEWIKLITEYRTVFANDWWPADLKRPQDPVFYRPEVAKELEQLFLKNQRMRWICRKFIARVRFRIMSKRIVGETDLYTMSAIPETHCIRVYDVKTRSVYQFHAHTMNKLILRSLQYSSYAIAAPHLPKNPYTNIKWNIAQLISITNQLLLSGSHYCRDIPYLLTLFRNSGFSIKTFFEKNVNHLQIEAAVHFFGDLDDADAKIMFLETYDDLCSYMDSHIYPLRIRRIRKVLEDTKDKELLQKWGKVITAFWIFYNHKIMWAWTDIAALTCSYHHLQRETVAKYLPRPSVEVNMVIIVDG